MSDLPSSGNIEAGRDIHAKNVITGIQQNFTVIFQQPFHPPPDLRQLRHDYLAYLRESYRYLDIKGIQQVQQVTQQLSLASVYVPLKAQTQGAAPGELLGRVAGRLMAPPEAEAAEAAMPTRQSEPVLIEEALKTDPAVVVLGDPGAGKSTLLKVLALALAGQPDGPLPILLPLNAYARHLRQQGEVCLGQFLGDYYATRQQKLDRVGELFNDALAKQQAVILLDGLDEVQAGRQYLVRLVEDFVAEHSPHPDDEGRRTNDHRPEAAGPAGQRPDLSLTKGAEVVTGNRVIVTSRIVGYEEAPLAGRQWRTYTLTDFSWADIEQFVRQWTLAFALSVQGDTGPARQAAERERQELLAAIAGRPSVERLAANPLLLTILALIKYTGVTLPEQRVKLYELYLEALIESWNLARSLDQGPVGPGINYEETVQVLAPLALWLRQENPTAGLVSQTQLEGWLTGYYRQEWGLPRGEARQRGRDFLQSVERYSNLLLERGERQYGFLHLTLEEMLAAKGIVQLLEEGLEAALAIFERYLLDPAWRETLQLAVAAIAIIQQFPKTAGNILQKLLHLEMPPDQTGRPAVFAGEVLLDVGPANVGRTAALKIEQALVETMQATACPSRTRREAGNLLGRLGWTPAPAADDLLLAPAGVEPTGLDTFRPVSTPTGTIWLGKYPVTNYQFARFIDDDGYQRREFWSDDGWAWRTGDYDSKAPDWLQDWLKDRPPEKRDRPYWWTDQKWNSPLYPVVGISWFEAEAYCGWLGQQLAAGRRPVAGDGQEIGQRLARGELGVRLPHEAEWEAAMGGRGDYPWGDRFDPNNLNCAESWFGRDFKDDDEWRDWVGSDTESWREASMTAVTTYPQGVSPTGVWDGSGNVWEWMGEIGQDGWVPLRGGAWTFDGWDARVSARNVNYPDYFDDYYGCRVVVAPVP